MITKYLNKASCESAEKVASIDDIIIEILLNLPVSSLFRFKFVSKHWLSLITSPHFCRLHIRRRPLRVRPSGLFIQIDETHTRYKHIPLDSSGPFHTVTFPTSCDPFGLRILQSCNGLLFCSNSVHYLCKHYIYNPTTRHFTVIPLHPSLTNYTFSHSTTLAFDPSTSPHYKLVSAHCVGGQIRKIMIYSSETKVWSVCRNQPANSMNLIHKINFSNGVYLNGAVHWMSFSPTTIYLKIDEERLETMPMPPILNNSIYMYFGASGDRLHLIAATYHLDTAPGPVFDVYEMAKDCSEWCLRYKVDLREVYWDRSRIEIKGIVRGEREDDSFLLFNAPLDNDEFMMVNIYKLADKTSKMLFITKRHGSPIHSIFGRSKAYEFIQSLSYV